MWFIIGIILGIVLFSFAAHLHNKKITITWYEWTIGIAGLLLLLFTLQNFISSFKEMEPTAAWMFVLIAGLPSLILLAVAWQLAVRRQQNN